MRSLVADKLAAYVAGRQLFTDLSFSIKPHELVIVRGINGAGKSTLLRQLAGLRVPSEGRVIMNRLSQQDIFYLGHVLGVNPILSIMEHFSLYYPNKMLEEEALIKLLSAFHLQESAHCLVGSLSAGQQKRLLLLLMTQANCLCWVLDEPYVALDDSGKALLDQLIQTHLSKGGMVVMATHDSLSWEYDKCDELLVSVALPT